ncbi:MAG: hypothetical protein ACKOUT_08320 [Novosphingobium sp.]
MKIFSLALFGSLLMAAPVTAQTTVPTKAAEEALPEAWFEIFKLVPGKQEDFIRRLNQTDQVRAAGGLPPVQLFFHENGADFDVILFKPVAAEKPTPEQEAKMAAKRKELAIPSGPAYFVDIREFIAGHTDSKTVGPVSAAQWLSRIDSWRANNPPRAKLK